jgi:pyridoxal phosphate enzyme (YggS family)
LTIAGNIESIRNRVRSAALRVERDPESVTIIAVTKTVETEGIEEALAAGVQILGENRVQEAREKIERLGRPVQWHMIGHLQTNKARQAAALFDMVHSVDSLRVAEALNREAGKEGKELPILLQVNVSGEERKFGVEAEEALSIVRTVSGMENLLIEGLMTIPPYFEDPEESRAVYRSLREMGREIVARNLPGVQMKHLSMGMSHDFETAVEEGATLVRVGTAIFGERV